MIRFNNVYKRFGGLEVLKDLSFEVRDGEIFCIVGSSGTGKSVTLKHMVRLLTPDRGEVLVGEDCVSSAAGNELRRIRQRFGYLFQSGALLAWLTVRENVGLPLREHTDLSAEKIDRLVREKLEMVGLDGVLDLYPADLSGGMRKRVGLARAIIRDPEIVLYDEPTSGLDPVTARRIDGLIQRLCGELGITSVVVTHDMHSALLIGSRIAMLHRGRAVEIAAPRDFIASGNSHVQGFLESQFITRKGAWEQTEAS